MTSIPDGRDRDPEGAQPQPSGDQPTYGSPPPPPYGTQPAPYGTQPAPYGTPPPPYGTQPPYATGPGPQYRYAPAQRTSNGLAISGLISGIAGLILFGVILGPLAIVLGWMGLRKARTLPDRRGETMSKWAMGLGIAATVFAVMVFGLFLSDPSGVL